MYLVTGGAGFIGSNLVKALNNRGIEDIVVVDSLDKAGQFENLLDCEIADFVDKEVFLRGIRPQGAQESDVCSSDLFLRSLRTDTRQGLQTVFHQGACSDTMEQDGRYMMETNYRFSKELLGFCQQQKIPFLYASSAAVYGSNTSFREQRECESPLNLYGYSKFLFDQYVRRILPGKTAQIAGFRYFNVYGPRERHKGRMASVAWHFHQQYLSSGKVRLFRGSGGYGDGEQRRDFVFVDDVVQVNLAFMDHPEWSGIFNLGTGRAQSFNEVAVAVINHCRRGAGEDALSLQQLQQSGAIEYIDFPPGLEERYQSYTQADLSRLRELGCKREL